MPKHIIKARIGKARMKTTVSEKILVVERERIVAMDIDCILRGSGYSQTTIAYSFEEAIGKITSIRPDLVLIDDQIGDTGDGRNGGRKIIEEFNIPVLYLSSSSPVKNRRGRKDRYAHYLHKPFDAIEVSKSVRKILSRKRP